VFLYFARLPTIRSDYYFPAAHCTLPLFALTESQANQYVYVCMRVCLCACVHLAHKTTNAHLYTFTQEAD